MQNGYEDLIESTRIFIEDDPVEIELQPQSAPVKKPGGGYDYNGSLPTKRQNQLFKLIPQGDNDGFVATEDGGTRTLNFVLVALPDAVIEVGDYWEDVNGSRYTVTGFHQHTDYELKASVVANGTEFSYG